MSAIPSYQTPAHLWFSQNYAEILSRARACLSRLNPDRKEEAMAEVIGSVFKAVVDADRRGVLANVTPYFLVVFAIKRHRSGRRLTGSSTRDVLSEATQIKGRCKVVSLAAIAEHDQQTGRPIPLSEVLADPNQDNNPYEHVRQNLDYPRILRKERVSDKARRVFRIIAEVRGQGAGLVMANELKVSPGRVSQLKTELADALRRNDYGTAPAKTLRPKVRQHTHSRS